MTGCALKRVEALDENMGKEQEALGSWVVLVKSAEDSAGE
jgi:hypothetical protein